jgi:DNA repair protein RecO (recombination protein O)
MISLTQGIVLKRIKYGDSSQIVHVFTKRFGLQSCIMKGLGKGKQGSRSGNLLFPSSLIDLSIYYHEEKNIKLIKEVHPLVIYRTMGESVLKNCVAVFAMEVLQNLLISDDIQIELFDFCQQFLMALDEMPDNNIANFPLYFLIKTGQFSGYHLLGEYCETTPYINLQDGAFVSTENQQTKNIIPESIPIMSQLNKAESVEDILSVKMTNEMRKVVLNQFLLFFEIHFPHFRPLKSVAVMAEILS